MTLPNTTPARQTMIEAESDASILKAIRDSQKTIRHASPHAHTMRGKIQLEGANAELVRYSAERERRGI